jgi:selenocysteine lyase/cysteine desulfurase
MLDRRDFLATGATLGAAALAPGYGGAARPTTRPLQDPRSAFPRLGSEIYVNGAGGTPLGSFAEEGIARYVDFARLGPADGRGDYFNEILGGVRGLFADLIGANESEVGFCHCTKAGEQILLDGLSPLRRGANVVTNDLHFSGSLHNYVGLRRAGMDVRIVRAEDDFDVRLDRMADAIDADTALVAVSLVSNVNGRIEPMAALARIAHERGAVVFADIIQAAGAIPIDVRTMGIDVAACSSYKWLFGVHGAGFLYVRDGLQGSASLPDRLFPGHVARSYEPWRPGDQAGGEPFAYQPPMDARRYQPGHVSYMGYAAVYEGLKFIQGLGVERIQRHATRLNRRLLDQLAPDAFLPISPHIDASPILALRLRDPEGVRERLFASDVVVSIGGDVWDQVRISPAIYNQETDMDRVAEVLNG